ncbi:hypothetical protein RB594_001068 [Gaeumannomyces avenae]
MKVFTLLTFPLLGLLGSALGSPAPATVSPATAGSLEGRQAESPLGLLESLLESIKGQTGIINSTISGLPADANVSTLDLAAPAIHDAVTQITSLIMATEETVTANAEEQKRALQARDLETRQADAIAIVWAIGAILVEISATLDAIINSPFGIGVLLGRLNPLTLALSALVAGLAVVVNGLLLLVGTLLNTILLGLSIALLGLSF